MTFNNTFHFIPADLDLILSKSPYLIQEMVSCVAQLIAMAKAGRSKSQFVNTREQTSKPQTNYRCCLRFSFLMRYWLFPRNTITFHKYFWCSRFCEFHSKCLFPVNSLGKRARDEENKLCHVFSFGLGNTLIVLDRP